MAPRRILTLRHEETGRLVPVEVVTVFGRSDSYYRYKEEDDRPDRLRADVVEGLAALNYIKICSDHKVSRTHGLIDPRAMGIADLNSTNGTFKDGVRLPTRYGQQGPLVPIAHDDAIGVGHQTFRAEVWEVAEPDLVSRVRQLRHAFTGCDEERLPRAGRLEEFLVERKGFDVRPGVGWPAVIANLYKLQEAAEAEGLVVICLSAEARAEELVLGAEPMPFAKLLPLVASIPGRKVVVLDVDGDPTACERRFVRDAYEDMVLLTSPGEVVLDEPVEHSVRTDHVKDVAASVAGEESLRGAFDDARDGLDALIQADTNILDVTWTQGYEGRLKVIFGVRARSDEHAVSHSLRFGSTTFRF